jgi:tetratricopeptide (TPR) repeat protein
VSLLALHLVLFVAVDVPGQIDAPPSLRRETLVVELARPQDPGQDLRAWPGADGQFVIRQVPEGGYQLRVRTQTGDLLLEQHVHVHSFSVPLEVRLRGADAERPVQGLVSVKRLQHKVPKKARQSFEHGAREVNQRNYPAALTWFKSALREDPAYFEAWVNLGVNHVRLGRHQEAVDAFDQAIQIDPAYAPAHSNRALALIHLKRLGDAEHAAQRSLQLDGAAVAPRYLLGLIRVQQGKKDGETLGLLREASESIPHARLAAAHLLAERGETNAAREMLEGYLRLPEQPHAPEARRMLASLR